VLVFAPLGFVLEASKLVPKLVERGKREVSNARVIGSFITPMAKRNAEKFVRNRIVEIKQSIDGTLTSESVPMANPAPTVSTPPESTPPESTPDRTAPDLALPNPTLPIEGYDQLPSSTIVELLDRLKPGERRAVEMYEQANRKRRTILTKARLLDSKRP
jgi:hypothetical protein